MYEEFPEVIELNVGGIHYTTHLSTLKKEEDSRLAELFSGRAPVYKDKDGRYFLDGDGKLFQHILDYLRADILPFQHWQQASLFGFGSSNDYNLNSFDKMVIALHKEAVLFGLTKLVRNLEQYKSVYIEQQLEKFRSSKTGYMECLQKILDVIPVNSMLGSTQAFVVFSQEGAMKQARCCEHSCLFLPSNTYFRQPRMSKEDIVRVKVPFEVDHTLLNCLYLDLTHKGFNVSCGISECNFSCAKEPRGLFGSSAFGGKPQRFCCRESSFYIQINFHLAPTQSAFSTQGFRFGGGAASGNQDGGGSGFGFGSQGQSGLFGSTPGSKEGGCFGSQQSSFGQGGSFGFGSQQNSQGGGFGQSGFGSQQSSQGAFGQSAFGGFGSQQNSQGVSGFGQSTPFGGTGFGGGAKTVQAKNSFGFGGPGITNQSSPLTFGQVQQTEQKSTSQSPKGFSFGSAGGSQPASKKTLFGMSAQPSTTGGFSFGGAPAFGKLPTVAKSDEGQDVKGLSFSGFSLPKEDDGDGIQD